MALKDITKPAVLKAIQECVRLGRESFLDKYGFGPAKLYRLVYDGRIYDSKAIVGVAHQYVRAGLGPLTSFSGGAKTVQPVLESLGFTVRVGRAELGDIVLPGEVDDNAFDPSNIEDARKRISRMIRRGHGRIYDSKAIVGVAHQYVRAGLGPLTSFSGGAKTVQPVLESLGFTVRVGRAELGDIVLPGEVDDNAFDPSNIEDARKRISRMIAQRRGQRAFRNNLFDAYGGRCAITGCEVPDVLEAAHIFPYRGEETNKVKNGLLLRADVHTLFDCGLIAVDEVKMTVLVAPALQDSEPDFSKPSSLATRYLCGSLPIP